MVALNDKERQVLELIGSLPPDRRRLLLHELARGSDAAWQRNTALAETQLRKLAATGGLVWEEMDDVQRQDFVCGLRPTMKDNTGSGHSLVSVVDVGPISQGKAHHAKRAECQ